ncbi:MULTISPECIES: hypothetical protein [unclassified Mesorhizobium]|uniref:hypothetical protein n=1 Tax=unclassified Mesorhizobium TaxID=325217 RepID=UPI000F757DA9|nr:MULTISPECIES: hypothetical protein [unclassified Mesorhizobium]AZO06330.1 hypothetical protein EJ068_27105 [Mesorhizobium sp. M2A.F.Ca.ET.043.02.1.1]RUW39337.1 hypothetical protein EOA37_20200 [Mesorhizobium sp. M2A.F.Ca.ET.015.02.1.1]RUW72028.1 hypothetical protein EOA28_21165 [Mesorhizobium sp. M2A.F.Ca.ET.067.02.1.1]RVC97342.1 hypothetical protein EN739_04775 [Mesorhizobium sp. M2A.F.Ca.ET.017.03.2.1]RVD09865.1 hypothetical protein EN753_08510 [Mesorhizobium sp. M2A.F.Ca.ET.029.05.1.1]
MIIAVLALVMTAATLMATAFGLYDEVRQNRSHAETDHARVSNSASPSRQSARSVGPTPPRHAHAAFPGHVYFSGLNPALSGCVRGAGAFVAFLSIGSRV